MIQQHIHGMILYLTCFFIINCLIISAHILKLLSQHPSIQQKTREEIRLLDKKLNGNPPNLHDITRCDYISAVIKEAQRLYPIAPMLLREAINDNVVHGITIPKGVNLFFFSLN